MVMRLWIILPLLLLSAGRNLSAHVFGERYAKHLKIDTRLVLNEENIEFFFTEHFTGPLYRKMWEITDSDRDGIISEEEREICLRDDRNLLPALLELRLDWLQLSPLTVENYFSGLVLKKPSGFSGPGSLDLHYKVSFRLPRDCGVHLLEVLLDLKAGEIVSSVDCLGPWTVARANGGCISPSGARVNGFIQRKGFPRELALITVMRKKADEPCAGGTAICPPCLTLRGYSALSTVLAEMPDLSLTTAYAMNTRPSAGSGALENRNKNREYPFATRCLPPPQGGAGQKAETSATALDTARLIEEALRKGLNCGRPAMPRAAGPDRRDRISRILMALGLACFLVALGLWVSNHRDPA